MLDRYAHEESSLIPSMRVIVVAVAITLTTESVLAKDGVVLINQARALAGGVTPADKPGFPVTIDRAGNYKLSGNLAICDPNTSAIYIKADNVNVDLNGFELRGACKPRGTCSSGFGVGVVSEGSHTTVRNGSITGMALAAVYLLGCCGDRVEQMLISDNVGFGIAASFTVMRSNVVVSNGGGIVGCCNLIVENIISNNGFYVIYGDNTVGYGNNVLSGNRPLDVVPNGPQQTVGNLCSGSPCP
jgi:hypothetical protein